MENERIPNDPYRSGLNDDDFGHRSRLETDAQFDPELAEGRASSGRIALFAIAIAVVLGAVFYGLNNTSVHQASNAPPTQAVGQPQAAPPAPNVNNTQPGVTTGSAAANRPGEPQGAPKATGGAGNPAAPAK